MEKIILSNGLYLWTESMGDPLQPACLLVSGAGAPAKFWSDHFCRLLVDKGYFIIRYDHRDQGLSDGVNWKTHPYSIGDLVSDALHILDTYQIEKSHVVGHSMGGMIAQLLAFYHAERVLTFTSMSVATIGKAWVPAKEIMDVLLENKPTQHFEHDLPGFMKSWWVLNGIFEVDKKMAEAYTRDFYIRSKHKVDVAWNHIRCQEKLGDLSSDLRKNNVPGLFIHGN